MDAANDLDPWLEIRNRCFALFQSNPLWYVRHTNYKRRVAKAVLSQIEPKLRASLLVDGMSSFDTEEALISCLAFFTYGHDYHKLSLILKENTTLTTMRVVRATLPVLAFDLPPPRFNGSEGFANIDEFTWRGWEEGAWEMLGLSHVIGFIQIIPLELMTDNTDYYCPILKMFCLKLLLVFSITGEIMFTATKPGSFHDQIILERSSFGKALRDPTNPLRMPRQLRFRDREEGSCNPVFLTLGQISPMYSPYVYVVDQLTVVKDLPLVIDRFCETFLAHSGLETTGRWVENGKNLRLIAFSAVNVYNFQVKLPVDPLCWHSDDFCGHDIFHICNRWCYHKCDFVRAFLARQTLLAPAEDTRHTLAAYWRNATIVLPLEMNWGRRYINYKHRS